ncbi:hypothetical protein C0J52_01117 [Blattella germanica]|nr:hypothetical protein C0J52_01117 [Blattella germanica]
MVEANAPVWFTPLWPIKTEFNPSKSSSFHCRNFTLEVMTFIFENFETRTLWTDGATCLWCRDVSRLPGVVGRDAEAERDIEGEKCDWYSRSISEHPSVCPWPRRLLKGHGRPSLD